MLNGGSANARSTDPAGIRRSPSTQSPMCRRSTPVPSGSIIVGDSRVRAQRDGRTNRPRHLHYTPSNQRAQFLDRPLDLLLQLVVGCLRRVVGGTPMDGNDGSMPPLGDVELEALKALWEAGPSTVRQVAE